MFKAIDNFLNETTMYRLLIYYLGGLLAVAFVAGLFGNLGFSAVALIISTTILLVACWGINRIFAFIFKNPVNHESSIITALILALLITPKLGIYDLMFLLAVSGLAMASKYILAINDVHIFNPAAIAVVITAFGPRQDASWWIGTAVMLPFVLAGGLLVIRKIRREQMVLAFFITAFATTVLFTLFSHGSILMAIKQTALTSPVFFLGFVMLTEPLTSPGTRGKQTWFGVLVGVLVAPQMHIASFYTSPEGALVIGNIFAYIINPRVRLFPILTQKIRVAANSVDFVFNPGKRLTYQPGQYMEWTLPHDGIDNRGNRRYFTLASSPTEPTLRLGVKFNEPSSSYKKAMLGMTEQTRVVAAHVVGDFALPKNPKRKLVLIAGGIGITPFRSMLKYLLDTGQQRDIVVLYAANSSRDIAYKEILEQARRELGITVIYFLTQPDIARGASVMQRAGYINADAIKDTVPDYHDRTFYISGSHEMVTEVRRSLVNLGVNRRHIKVDYFPGYA